MPKKIFFSKVLGFFLTFFIFTFIGSQKVLAQSCSSLTINGSANQVNTVVVGDSINVQTTVSDFGMLFSGWVRNVGDMCVESIFGCSVQDEGWGSLSTTDWPSREGILVYEVNAYESDQCLILCSGGGLIHNNVCGGGYATCADNTCFVPTANSCTSGCRKWVVIVTPTPTPTPTPIPCPTVTSITCSGEDINLQWSNTGATEYRVMRSDGGGPWNIVWQGPGLSFLDTGAACGVQHRYRIYPVSASGSVNTSCAQDATIKCDCPNCAAADTPDLTVAPALPFENPVQFSWTSPDTNGDGVTNMNVHYRFRNNVGGVFSPIECKAPNGSKLETVTFSAGEGPGVSITSTARVRGVNYVNPPVDCLNCLIHTGVNCCLSPNAGWADYNRCVACIAPVKNSTEAISCGSYNGTKITWTDNSDFENGFRWYRNGTYWQSSGAVVRGTYVTTDCTNPAYPFGTEYSVRCYTNDCPAGAEGSPACSLNLSPDAVTLSQGMPFTLNSLLTIQNGTTANITSSSCVSSDPAVVSVAPSDANPDYDPNPYPVDITAVGAPPAAANVTCQVGLTGGGSCSDTTAVTVNFPAWYQTMEGDVHAQSKIQSLIPSTATYPYFSREGGANTPGVTSYGGVGADFGSGTVARDAAERWLVNDQISSRALISSYFNYFNNILGSEAKPGSAAEAVFSADLFGALSPDTDGVLYFDHNVRAADVWNIGDSKIVLLIDGTFLIRNAINVNSNGTGSLVVVSSGDMGVHQTNPAATSIRGIFVTDGRFVSSATTSDIIPQVSDQPLQINGTVVSREDIILNRDLGAAVNTTSPAERFFYDAGLFINAYPRLWREYFTWQEMAP